MIQIAADIHAVTPRFVLTLVHVIHHVPLNSEKDDGIVHLSQQKKADSRIKTITFPLHTPLNVSSESLLQTEECKSSSSLKESKWV